MTLAARPTLDVGMLKARFVGAVVLRFALRSDAIFYLLWVIYGVSSHSFITLFFFLL
jgi:hypothetical protein